MSSLAGSSPGLFKTVKSVEQPISDPDKTVRVL
jgi:hypothetical protein